MERLTIDPRPDWADEIAKLGYGFFEPAGIRGWQETTYMRLERYERAALSEAAAKVYQLSLVALERVVKEKLYPLLGIDSQVGKIISHSWERGDVGICNRINFIYNGDDPPKVISIDADNPTGLFETAVVQREWRYQRFPQSEQFNSLHDALIGRWESLTRGRRNLATTPLYLSTVTPDTPEEHSVHFMGITAQQGGWSAQFIPTQDIGWDAARQCFTDVLEQPILWIYKRYPWSDILGHAGKEPEPFGLNVIPSGSVWFEPPWKIVMESKAFLALLWDTYPQHPNLLPTFTDGQTGDLATHHVKKPAFGHYGENIQIRSDRRILEETGGDCDGGDFVYQDFVAGPSFGGNTPVFGVWMVGEEACGLSIREDTSLIVRRGSSFLPHIIT